MLLKTLLQKITLFRETLIICLLAACLIYWQQGSFLKEDALLYRLELLLYDFRMKFTSKITHQAETDKHVVIVDIDEDSLQQEGRWPWSRARVATMIDHLREAGAVVIAFDVVFSEPERETFLRAIKNIGIYEEHKASLDLLFEAWNPDQMLGHAMSNIDVVLGFIFHLGDTTGLASAGTLRDPIFDVPKDSVIIEAKHFTAPLKDIQSHAIKDGFITTMFDADGVIRRTPLFINHEGKAYPSLALSAAMSYLLVDDIDIVFSKAGNTEYVSHINVTNQKVDTDERGRVLIPFQQTDGHFEYISAKDVLNKTVNPEQIKGKIVFVGTSSVGLADLVSTPFTTHFPGVEVNAIITQAIVSNGKFHYHTIPMLDTLSVFQIGLSFCLIWLFRNRKPLTMVVLASLVITALISTNFFIWTKWNIDLPLVVSLALTLSMFLWYLVLGYVSEYKEEQRIKGMFAQYIPPAHIEHVLDDPEKYSMTGENKELTVLFSDIRGFTSISERLSASELKTFLNMVFTPITEAIFNNKGTIDKYVGDMVMAFWGAPIDDPDHRLNAILTALSMQKIADSLSASLAAQDLPAVEIGIGLNTGFMNVGDMGSEYRKAYTVLGDAVNLGSRLESLTKFYGVKILVGEDTAKGVEPIAFRLCDRIRVKGKDVPIDAYEPLGLYNEMSQPEKQALLDYHRAIAYYRDQSWAKAKDILRQLYEEDPDCLLYSLYLERIKGHEANGVPENWDEVYSHTSK